MCHLPIFGQDIESPHHVQVLGLLPKHFLERQSDQLQAPRRVGLDQEYRTPTIEIRHWMTCKTNKRPLASGSSVGSYPPIQKNEGGQIVIMRLRTYLVVKDVYAVIPGIVEFLGYDNMSM